jgi:hypothetical protein
MNGGCSGVQSLGPGKVNLLAAIGLMRLIDTDYEQRLTVTLRPQP